MTPQEKAAVRDLLARVRLLEQENRYLRASKATALVKKRKFKDAARDWHGRFLAQTRESA